MLHQVSSWLPIETSQPHGTDGGTRTRKAEATALSTQRVYQFHHIRMGGEPGDPDPPPGELGMDTATSIPLRRLPGLLGLSL